MQVIIFFTELKTIPVMIVVTVHSGMETIVKVVQKKETQNNHANTNIKYITVTIFLKKLYRGKVHAQYIMQFKCCNSDCPVGYTGDNCSDVCPPHTYGKLCSQSCKCTSCHHIFGCMTTGKIFYINIFKYYTLSLCYLIRTQTKLKKKK